jgi:hypothetical protein
MSFTGIGLMLGSCLVARGSYSDEAPCLRLFTLHLLICMFKTFRPHKFILFFFLVEKKTKSPLPPPPFRIYILRKMVRKVKFGIKVCRVKLNIGRFSHFGNGFQLWALPISFFWGDGMGGRVKICHFLKKKLRLFVSSVKFN